jgi:hypothetical protein
MITMGKEKLETVKDLNLILKHLDKIGGKYICFSDVLDKEKVKLQGFICIDNLDLCHVLNVFMVFMLYVGNKLKSDTCDCEDCVKSREVLEYLVKTIDDI